MKQRKFGYSVLKFRTSYVLDERVNIGLLFRFENAGTEKEGMSFESTDKYYFIFPKVLTRVTNFFSEGVKEEDLNKLLYGFREKVNEVNKTEKFKAVSLEDFIQNGLLVKDANSYFFSDVRHGIYDSEKAILDYYEEDYFKLFK